MLHSDPEPVPNPMSVPSVAPAFVDAFMRKAVGADEDVAGISARLRLEAADALLDDEIEASTGVKTKAAHKQANTITTVS